MDRVLAFPSVIKFSLPKGRRSSKGGHKFPLCTSSTGDLGDVTGDNLLVQTARCRWFPALALISRYTWPATLVDRYFAVQRPCPNSPK